jgi:hypothetical protein
VSNTRFEEALDCCIADIVSGRRSVADCLAEWPQFRDELAPLLEAATAMDAEPPIAERPPDPVRRAELMATIRTTPQQSPRPGLLRALGRLTMPRLALPPAVRQASLIASAAAVLAIAALAATLVIGQGTGTAYASTVTVFAGTVEQQVDGDWVAVADGATLSEGARLRTGDDGSALLTFVDGSTVGIEANTELLIEFVVFGVARQISLQQFSGSLWNDVVPDASAGSFYTVRTPDAVVSARGTLFETKVADGETTVDTFDGLVEVAAGDETTFVTPGEFATARAHRQVIAAQAREDASGLALSVAAPFAASLVAPGGKATGVRQDGVAFNQISGAATSHPADGDQRLELSRLTPGTYRLLMTRTGEGDGEIVLQFGSERLTLPITAGDNTIAVDLRVSIDADGRLRVEPVNQRVIEAREAEHGGARVVTSEAARSQATPPARRPDPAEGGDRRPRRGGSLQDQARDRLQQMLENDGEGLGQRLGDKAKQKLRGRLDQLDEREAEREQERGRRDDERGSRDSDGADSDDQRDGAQRGRDGTDAGRGQGNGASNRDTAESDRSDDDAGNDERTPQRGNSGSGRPGGGGSNDDRSGDDDESNDRAPQPGGGPGRPQRAPSRP